ncbi:metalloprotease [Coemansia aciculifera]|nr:metalloprotease [Coemansia aciculifera]
MLSGDLIEDLYNAACAGLGFGVSASFGNIDIGVTGYASKLPDLLVTVLEKAKGFKVDEARFSIYMEKFKLAYGNVANSTPSEFCHTYNKYINMANTWHYKLMEAELAKVTPAKLQEHVNSLFDTTYLKMLMVGNFDEEEALQTAERVKSIIEPVLNKECAQRASRAYNFEPGYLVHQMKVLSDDHLNSAVLCDIYCGLMSNKREVILLDILDNFISDSFFAQLRTKHQLGYGVSLSSSGYLGGRSVLTLQVEGESNPMYVTMHINKFINDMQKKVEDMTDEQFASRVQTLVKMYQERVKNIFSESVIYETHVWSETYNFSAKDTMLALLKDVKKGELLEFWNKYINPSTAPAYTRVDIQVWSTKIWKPTADDLKQYSAKTLGLFGCLHSEGNTALDIGKVDEFVKSEIAAHNGQTNDTDDIVNPLVEALKNASLSESGASYTVGESEERAIHTATALELAIKDHATFGDYSHVSQRNFATIGMSNMPDGMWLLEDYKRFQATQKINGLVVPAEILAPKYND